MKNPKHPKLIRRMRDARLKKLGEVQPLLAASLVQIAKHCGRRGCRCQRGEKHVGHYITFGEGGKTRTVYVPVDLVEDVRSWVKEHKRVKTMLREISALSVALIRGHAAEKRRHAGRE